MQQQRECRKCGIIFSTKYKGKNPICYKCSKNRQDRECTKCGIIFSTKYKGNKSICKKCLNKEDVIYLEYIQYDPWNHKREKVRYGCCGEQHVDWPSQRQTNYVFPVEDLTEKDIQSLEALSGWRMIIEGSFGHTLHKAIYNSPEGAYFHEKYHGNYKTAKSKEEIHEKYNVTKAYGYSLTYAFN